MADFKGLIPAIITPMTPDDKLNESAFRKVLEFNIKAGVHGLWLAGGAGESILLDDLENRRIAEIGVDQSRGRVKIIMQVGSPTTVRSARMAENAARAGVDALCCLSPFIYGQTDEAMVEHFKTVAGAADLPFFLYNLPQATGVEITPDLAKKVQEGVPQLIGLKHSAWNYPNIRRFTKMGLLCFTGDSSFMLPALTLGAAGCIDGSPCTAPEIWVTLWKAYQAGDIKSAEAAQQTGAELYDIVQEFGFPVSLKVLLSERLGIECGDPRPPGTPLTPDRRKALWKKASDLGLKRVTVD